jgi:hypothetical protein
MIDIIKIGALYIILLSIFYSIKSNFNRFILTLLLYIFTVYTLNINYKYGIYYLIIALCCVFTEHIFIKYIKLSWDYRNPDILSVPYWLIPLWGIAIVFIIKLSKNMRFIKNIHLSSNNLKKFGY